MRGDTFEGKPLEAIGMRDKRCHLLDEGIPGCEQQRQLTAFRLAHQYVPLEELPKMLPNFFIGLIHPALPTIGRDLSAFWEMVGDTGFEPLTSTVCRKHPQNVKPRK